LSREGRDTVELAQKNVLEIVALPDWLFPLPSGVSENNNERKFGRKFKQKYSAAGYELCGFLFS